MQQSDEKLSTSEMNLLMVVLSLNLHSIHRRNDDHLTRNTICKQHHLSHSVGKASHGNSARTRKMSGKRVKTLQKYRWICDVFDERQFEA